MIVCKYDCIPCCDFCIYAEHEYIDHQGLKIKSVPMDCNLHGDIEHREIADADGYCRDFHCILAKSLKFHIKDV